MMGLYSEEELEEYWLEQYDLIDYDNIYEFVDKYFDPPTYYEITDVNGLFSVQGPKFLGDIAFTSAECLNQLILFTIEDPILNYRIKLNSDSAYNAYYDAFDKVDVQGGSFILEKQVAKLEHSQIDSDDDDYVEKILEDLKILIIGFEDLKDFL